MDDPLQLLILDFEGVCTRSGAELASADAPLSLAAAVRAEAEPIVLDAQQRGVLVMILSNEINPEWAATVPLLASVDRVVACSDNGIFKPDRRAFQRCLLLSGVAAENTLVVDDHPDNIAVANSLGMHTVLFDPADAAASWLSVRAALEAS